MYKEEIVVYGRQKAVRLFQRAGLKSLDIDKRKVIRKQSSSSLTLANHSHSASTPPSRASSSAPQFP